ncbi:hypothetical protein, partial [Puia dinghuensis]|uniref:hypothetical protein n=1 Tax=Puia dinghuensis TaxID=1792502 RepID=UPI00166B07F8
NQLFRFFKAGVAPVDRLLVFIAPLTIEPLRAIFLPSGLLTEMVTKLAFHSTRFSDTRERKKAGSNLPFGQVCLFFDFFGVQGTG